MYKSYVKFSLLRYFDAKLGRSWTISLIFLFVLYLLVMLLKHSGIGLIYQPTASMPKGLYVYHPFTKYQKKDKVLIQPSLSARQLMLERGYLNHNQPLLKTISAKKGDYVCIIDDKLYINQQFRGHVPLKDSNQRRLIPTKLCRKLIKGEFFVTGSGSYRSFDSRYFGVIHTEQIQAEAELLWQN